MRFSDKELGNYVSKKLALPGDERDEHRAQVGRLLDKLESVLHEDGSYRIQKFRRAGSLEKGTSNRPRAGKPVDADVGVYFDVDDPTSFDIADLQQLIKKLLSAAYPQKSEDDFDDTGARTFGVVFQGSGLEIDLVPIVSLDRVDISIGPRGDSAYPRRREILRASPEPAPSLSPNRFDCRTPVRRTGPSGPIAYGTGSTPWPGLMSRQISRCIRISLSACGRVGASGLSTSTILPPAGSAVKPERWKWAQRSSTSVGSSRRMSIGRRAGNCLGRGERIPDPPGGGLPAERDGVIGETA